MSDIDWYDYFTLNPKQRAGAAAHVSGQAGTWMNKWLPDWFQGTNQRSLDIGAGQSVFPGPFSGGMVTQARTGDSKDAERTNAQEAIVAALVAGGYFGAGALSGTGTGSTTTGSFATGPGSTAQTFGGGGPLLGGGGGTSIATGSPGAFSMGSGFGPETAALSNSFGAFGSMGAASDTLGVGGVSNVAGNSTQPGMLDWLKSMAGKSEGMSGQADDGKVEHARIDLDRPSGSYQAPQRYEVQRLPMMQYRARGAFMGY